MSHSSEDTKANESLPSSRSSIGSQIEPLPIQHDDEIYKNLRIPTNDHLLRWSSGLSKYRLTLSRMNSRALESFSVKNIYGDMHDEDICAIRDRNQNQILRTLLHRVSREATREPLRNDVEKQLDEPLYETLPDHPVPVKEGGAEFEEFDRELVTWDGPDDPYNPRNWLLKKKSLQTIIVSTYTLVSPMSLSVLSPAMGEIGNSINLHLTVLKSFCVSIMVLAWAIGPLIIAPISESDRVGRLPVLNISIFITFAFNLACGFVKTPAQLCVCRFLGGLGGCAPLNVGAGTLADIWSDKERQKAMALYSLAPLLGPCIAPIISSFVVVRTNWHWCFFYLAIFNFCVGAVGLCIFEETYQPRLLRKKAEMLRRETGNQHLHTIYEIADGETAVGRLVTLIQRPLELLTGHPMVFGLGLFMAFCYGFMYLIIVTFPSVFRGVYGMSIEILGLMYIPLGLGFFLGTIFFGVFNEWMYRRLVRRNNGVSKPEFKLPGLCASGFLIPVAMIWYGWSSQKKLHWIMPLIGAVIFGFGECAVFQNVQNYLIDMNNRFAASSVAAAAVFRSLFGFSFPLFASFMYARLNYGWGNTMMAFVGILLGVPFPIFCLLYGERLRNWANRRFDKKQAVRDAKNLDKLRRQNEARAAK